MTKPVVSVKGVGKVYNPFPLWMRTLVRSQVRTPVVALEDVSFDLQAGQICGVIGPNGAGKSTVFRILTGLTTPTSGSAQIMGIDTSLPSGPARRYIGFMPADDRSLWLRQTCRENLQFNGRLRGLTERELRRRIDETLDIVGLTEARDRVGFALSSGMRARLQLARALLHQPQVLILDEPTSSVDPVSSHGILELLRHLAQDRGLAVLISSHRVEEIEALHDNIVLLDRGRVVHWGNLDALRNMWTRPNLEIVFAEVKAARVALALLEKTPGVEIVARTDSGMTVRTELETGRLLTMLNGQLAAVASIRESKAPLREIMAAIAQANRAPNARGDAG